MRIELNWNNANPALITTTEIYRNSETDVLEDLSNGTLIATIVSPQLSFTDGDVIENKVYYYRFKTKSSGYKPVVSASFSFTASPSHGPGKHVLLFGDEAFGVYSIVQPGPTTLPPSDTLRTMLGFQFEPLPLDDHYYKYVVGGQVMYFPSMPLCLLSEMSGGNGIIEQILAGTPYEFTWDMWTFRLRMPEYVAIQDTDIKLGEATRLLDAITNMYVQSNWIFPQGFKIEGKLNYEHVMKQLGPMESWDLITSTYKHADLGTFVYRHYHATNLPEGKLPNTLYLVQIPNTETIVDGGIWPVLELVGITPVGGD